MSSRSFCLRPQSLLLCLPILLLATSRLEAQGPAADWRTLETRSFLFHFPAEAEDFTRHSAARLEAIRDLVAEEVGYRPEGRTEVLVLDPFAAANGSAWPMAGWSRLMLYTTPPEPESLLGFYADWSTNLALHEEVHLAHLLRPSRRPLERSLGRLLPIGPVARKSPRWVSEGYATYLEGKLTGYGRPQGDWRPALLRRWAQQGYLPSYGELNGSPRRFQGGSFPYLVGSAFLEWLVAREGEASLRHLWARLSAVENRSFDDAFGGVFGESPATLYRRFSAELTFEAMRLEEKEEGRGSELWQDLDGRPSAPVLSPDGKSLAIVLHHLGEPARLVVFSTEPDAEAEKKAEERSKAQLVRDPGDVAAVRRKPWPAKRLRELRAINGGDFLSPRFYPDGKALLLTRLEPGADARLLPGLYRFDIASGELAKLEHGAGLRDGVLLPSGHEVIALRQIYGRTQLVRVDLQSGAEQILDAPPFPVVFADPRVAPNGKSLALLVHRDGGWQLEIRPLAGPSSSADADPDAGAEEAQKLDLPARAQIADPSFSRDGRYLYATLGQEGSLDIYRFELESGKSERLSHEPGAAFGAAPGEQQLYFLALEPDGFDVRRLDLPELDLPETGRAAAEASSQPACTEPTHTQVPPTAALLVVRRPEIKAAPLPPPATLPPSKSYGGGKLELLPLLAGNTGSGSDQDGGTIELGLRAGDLIGRGEAFLLLAAGESQGVGLKLRWRGLPVVLLADLFELEEAATARRSAKRRYGLALGLMKERASRAWRLEGEIGAAWQDLEFSNEGSGFEEERIYGRARGVWRHDRGVYRVTLNAGADAAFGWRQAGDNFHLAHTTWRFEAAREPFAGRPVVLGIEIGAGRGGGRGSQAFELGGVSGSILPAALQSERLLRPGLPAKLLAGERYESARIDLRATRWPLRLFGEKYRFESQGMAREEVSLWGLEVELHNAAMPFLRLPASSLRAGVLQILDGSLEDEVELYLSFAWRP